MKLSRYFLQSHSVRETIFRVEGPCKHVKFSVKSPEGLHPRHNGEPKIGKTFQGLKSSCE